MGKLNKLLNMVGLETLKVTTDAEAEMLLAQHKVEGLVDRNAALLQGNTMLVQDLKDTKEQHRLLVDDLKAEISNQQTARAEANLRYQRMLADRDAEINDLNARLTSMGAQMHSVEKANDEMQNHLRLGRERILALEQCQVSDAERISHLESCNKGLHADLKGMCEGQGKDKARISDLESTVAEYRASLQKLQADIGVYLSVKR